MEKYTDTYMETHCIDVFFTDGDRPIHIMTAGNAIPPSLNDLIRNRTLQQEIDGDETDLLEETETNQKYIDTLKANHEAAITEVNRSRNAEGQQIEYHAPDDKEIAAHFTFYAQRGFYSYDLTCMNKKGRAVYRLMAYPTGQRNKSYILPQLIPGSVQENNPELPISEYIIP